MLEENDPRLSVVSCTILASNVDFPDATVPITAVKPGRRVRLRLRSADSELSALQPISASSNLARVSFGAEVDAMSRSGVPGNNLSDEDRGDVGDGADVDFFRR